MRAFTDALRQQEVAEERRTAYVALTRARQHLYVSSAHWYGESLRAKGVGTFFVELKRLAEQEGHPVSFSGSDAETNPLEGYRQGFVRPWPGPARPVDADALFPQGWRRAAAEAFEDGSIPRASLAVLTEDETQTVRTEGGELRTLAEHLIEREAAMGSETARPTSVSVGGLIDYGRCPKLHYWSAVRPLPRFAGPRARIGSEVHRWIEMQSRGQATLLELDDEPDLTVEELAGTHGTIENLRSAFLRSRFGRAVPLYAERPFILPVEGITIRAGSDAIYGLPEGLWEIVDYKTGRPPATDDVLARTQLDVYALACIEVWHKRPEDLLLTYLYSRPARSAARRRRRGGSPVTRGGLAPGDRRGRVRADAGRAVPLVRLPPLLRRGSRVARARGRRVATTTSAGPPLLERPELLRWIPAALHTFGDEPNGQTERPGPGEQRGAEPLTRARLQ
jgi:DNA helicase-2/ATP-dependent DNA helicase PcrA